MSEHERNSPLPTPSIPPMSSAVGEYRKVKRNSAATVEELREFLGQMKGRSPADMLGAVAQSKLIRSIVLATMLTAGFLVAATIVPYLLRDDGTKPVVATTEGEKAEPSSPSDRPQPAAPPAPETASTTDDPNSAEPVEPPPVDDILGTLGIGETKTAPPSVNPLDGGIDDLLDDLE